MINLEEINSYQENGFLHLKSFYGEEFIHKLRGETKLFLKNFKSDTSEENNSDFEEIDKKIKIKYCQSVFDCFFESRKLLTSKLIQTASMLIDRENVFLSGLEIHIRNAGGGIIPAHQDNISFCLKKAKAVTAYIALDYQDELSGGLGYLPTKKGGVLKKHAITDIPGFSSAINIEKNRNIIFPKINPGDVVFHHCQTPHLAKSRPMGMEDAIAFSPRFFSFNDEVDYKKMEIYKSKLSYHRSRRN